MEISLEENVGGYRELPQHIYDANKKLERLYGFARPGKPWYRVVWSTSQMEKRVAKRNVYVGELFIRQEKGIFDCPKYWWCKDRWVLEKLMHFPPSMILLMETERYEGFIVFQDENGKYLDATWEDQRNHIGIGHAVHFAQTGKSNLPKTEKEANSQALDNVAREQRANRNHQQAVAPSSILVNLNKGSGIINPGYTGQTHNVLKFRKDR